MTGEYPYWPSYEPVEGGDRGDVSDPAGSRSDGGELESSQGGRDGDLRPIWLVLADGYGQVCVSPGVLGN